MIKNSDGTPYKLKGEFSAYDPENKSLELINKWDQELIRMNGTPVYYYQVIIDTNMIDEVYNEARNKLFNPCFIKMWCNYQPQDQQNLSTLFGMDGSPDEEIILEFNYQSIKNCIPDISKMIGSRIFTPHRRENWIVIDYKLSDFKLWSAFRLLVHCKKFQETSTTSNGEVTKINPC